MHGLSLPEGPLEVLFLGAHPDDIEIGCGATMLTLAAARELRARVAVMSGSGVRVAEAHAAATAFLAPHVPEVQVLGLPDGRLPAAWGEVKQALEDLARGPKPDLIFAPRRDDAHQDHRLIAELVATAWRDSVIAHYEIPKWDGDLAPVTHYVHVTDEVAKRKSALLDQVYPSQVGRDWWDEETFSALMRLRGVESRSRYAEAFVVPKTVLTF